MRKQINKIDIKEAGPPVSGQWWSTITYSDYTQLRNDLVEVNKKQNELIDHITELESKIQMLQDQTNKV